MTDTTPAAEGSQENWEARADEFAQEVAEKLVERLAAAGKHHGVVSMSAHDLAKYGARCLGQYAEQVQGEFRTLRKRVATLEDLLRHVRVLASAGGRWSKDADVPRGWFEDRAHLGLEQHSLGSSGHMESRYAKLDPYWIPAAEGDCPLYPAAPPQDAEGGGAA